MTSDIAINFTETNQNSVSLFRSETQKIIFTIVSIIATLASTALVIGAIVFNMPLLCLGLILLISIVLLSFLLLSNLSKLKIPPEEKPSNITNPFTPKTTFLTNFCLKITTKTTYVEATSVFQQLTKEAYKKRDTTAFPQARALEGDFVFPPVTPKENKSTAIVAFSGLTSASITQENVTERSWKSALNPNLPKGAISSGYLEYKNPEDSLRYPFVRLLIQAQGTSIAPGDNPKNFIKVLKTTYLNIFAICEAEGINIVHIPDSGYCLTSKNNYSEDQHPFNVFNRIALLEALLAFNFSSIKTIYFVSHKKQFQKPS